MDYQIGTAKTDSVLLHMKTLLRPSLTIYSCNVHKVKEKAWNIPLPRTDLPFVSLTHTQNHN